MDFVTHPRVSVGLWLMHLFAGLRVKGRDRARAEIREFREAPMRARIGPPQKSHIRGWFRLQVFSGSRGAAGAPPMSGFMV